MTTLLAHEWIARDGGSENVLEQMRGAIPAGSRFVCIWNDDPTRFPGTEESGLARWPTRGRKAFCLPLMPRVWSGMSLAGVDRVIASSHAFSHHLAAHAAREGIPSFAYVHSPARYVWTPELDRRGASLPARLVSRRLRKADLSVVSPEVSYAANSSYVADRIRSCWGVDASVIYPPVNIDGIFAHRRDRKLSGTDQALADSLPPEFILGASRLVDYKRVDTAIRVGELADLPVIVAGSGPAKTKIEHQGRSASVPVRFLGRVTDELLRELYVRARLYVFMAVEDFGIMPVEAMAAGTPVLANRLGGAAESVAILGRGATADPDDEKSLGAAVEKAFSIVGDVDDSIVRQFSDTSFRRRFEQWSGPTGFGET